MLGEEQRCSSSTSGGGKGGYWFLPRSDCVRCPAVTSSRCRRAARLCQTVTCRLEAPAREDRKAPWWGCPSPSLSTSCSWVLGRLWTSPALGFGQVAQALCVPRGHKEAGQGVAGPAHNSSIERAEQRDKEQRRVDLILYINTLYNLEKAQC